MELKYMRASGVNAAIMRVQRSWNKKKRAIGNAHIWVARISGFYCTIYSDIKFKNQTLETQIPLPCEPFEGLHIQIFDLSHK